MRTLVETLDNLIAKFQVDAANASSSHRRQALNAVIADLVQARRKLVKLQASEPAAEAEFTMSREEMLQETYERR